MRKLRQTALILGLEPTEFFYFKSLCDVFKYLTIKPDNPKHTNVNIYNIGFRFYLSQSAKMVSNIQNCHI